MSKEETLKKFDDKFPCINRDCDSNGTIANQVGQFEWEPEKCQICHELRLPIRQFISDAIEQTEKRVAKEIFSEINGLGINRYDGVDQYIRGRYDGQKSYRTYIAKVKEKYNIEE